MNSDVPTARPEGPVDPVSEGTSRQLFNSHASSRTLREVAWAIIYVICFRWVPNRFGGWRRWLLRCFGARIAATSFVDRSVVVRCPWNLTLGNECVVHHNVILDCMGPIVLGNGSRISQYSHLCTRTHDYREVNMPVLSRAIVLGEFVWIAADAYVGPGVTIGDCTIVGARSSVLRDLPAAVTAVGEPARPIRSRRPEELVAEEARTDG